MAQWLVKTEELTTAICAQSKASDNVFPILTSNHLGNIWIEALIFPSHFDKYGRGSLLWGNGQQVFWVLNTAVTSIGYRTFRSVDLLQLFLFFRNKLKNLVVHILISMKSQSPTHILLQRMGFVDQCVTIYLSCGCKESPRYFMLGTERPFYFLASCASLWHFGCTKYCKDGRENT